jgi:biotin synthesis protein BioG
MKKYLINNHSDTLLLFFTGWGCDEYEFEHLQAESDVLLLFDYSDLNLYFDFSKYKKIDLIAFSAGVFVASIFNFDFEIGTKIAIDGNPYLFDEYFGLSIDMQNILYNITEANAEDFARNYLVKTDTEWKNFHPSKRTLESCRIEFDNLKKIYQTNKQKITNIYNFAIFGEEDPIFNVAAQKEFYGNRLNIVKNARHNLFFRISRYKQIFNYLAATTNSVNIEL